MTKPLAYQLEDIEQVERWAGRGLLGWEMGLGKSFGSLLYAVRNPTVRPIVVVCPATVKYQWEREAKHHFGLRAEVLGGTTPPKKGFTRNRPITIVNYEILGRRREKRYGPGWLSDLKKLQPQLVIIDECQYLGNPYSKQTKWVKQLCQGVPHVIALSGTPFLNRPFEMFSTLNILAPEQYPSLFAYAMRHCGPRRVPWGNGWDFRGSSNLKELHQKLTNPDTGVMVRRRQADVLQNLPSHRKSVIPFALPNGGEYEDALKDFRGWMAKRNPTRLSSMEKAERLSQLTALKQLVGIEKLPVVIDWVKEFLAESEDKLVLFAIHRAVVKELYCHFPSAVVVNGSITGKERQQAVDRFQHSKKCRLLIGNIKAAGIGLNLTAGTTVVFGEYPWTPGALDQAIKRIRRIGQKKKTRSVFLVAKGTIEEKLLALIERKQKTINSVLDNGRGEDFNIMDKLAQSLLKRT